MARSYVHFMFDVDGLSDVRLMLRHAERKTIDMSPLFETTIDDIIKSFFHQVFETQGSEAGRKWAPLKESTIRARTRRLRRFRLAERAVMFPGGSNSILHWTGAARQSLESTTENTFLRIKKRTYERATTLSYMALHQTGYTLYRWGHVVFKHPVKVPARKWMPKTLKSKYVREIEQAIADFILERGGRRYPAASVNRF